MTCTDITEYQKLIINDNDELVLFEAVKKTCGKKIGSKRDFLAYKNKELTEILEIPFQADADIFQRKFLINIQSIIREYLGLPPNFNHVTASILGLETEDNSVSVLAKIEFNAPIEEITPCTNCCQTRTPKIKH